MTVTLVEKYNPEWPVWFEKIKEFLGEKIVCACLLIEHVGSTSIPGMTAKPIIDLILVIKSGELEKMIDLLAERGYLHEGNGGIEEREVFKLEDGELKDSLPHHHLYVCPEHALELKKETAFRDFLKRNKEYAEKLSALKWSLAEQFDNDVYVYMDGKDALVKEITEKALRDK
jgi:GrpB-like predicted nucleotidyltransferase (UPF0157 family)